MPSWIGLAKWAARDARDLPADAKAEPGDKTGSVSLIPKGAVRHAPASQEQENQQLRRQDPEAHDKRIHRRIGNRLR